MHPCTCKGRGRKGKNAKQDQERAGKDRQSKAMKGKQPFRGEVSQILVWKAANLASGVEQVRL